MNGSPVILTLPDQHFENIVFKVQICNPTLCILAVSSKSFSLTFYVCLLFRMFWRDSRFFLSATFLWATPGWNWQKIRQMLSNTLRLKFGCLKIIHFLHLWYRPKLIWNILKNIEKNKYVCFNEIIWLIMMEMRVKMKIRLHRNNIIELYQDMVTNIPNINCVSVWWWLCAISNTKQYLKVNSWKS